MAQLKDLIVNGATQLIGDAYVNTIQITKLNAPTSAGGSTYGAGSENQVLLSNGSSIYWGKANISSFTNDAGYITSADVPEGASAYTGTISAVGTTASTGTNNGFARGDHVHNITKATIDNRLGTGSGTTKYYREDGTWQVPPNTGDTHYTAYLRAGASGGTANAATTTGNTYLNLVENGANRSGVKLVPGSNMTITSDANGNVTFTATNTVTTVTTSGSGNAITAISATNGAITATKGTTFLTSHQDISGKADKSATVSTVAWDSTNKKITKTVNGTTSDVVQFVANGGVTLTGESGKLTISSSASVTAFEIPITYSSNSYQIASSIKGSDIVQNIDNCYLNIDGYGKVDIDNYLTDTVSGNIVVTIFAKGYDDIQYFGTEYTMFKITAINNNTAPTIVSGKLYIPLLTTYTNAILTSNGNSTLPSWKPTANGAAYATSANGALTFGTLPVAQGGTGATSFTANRIIMSGNSTTAALTTRAVTNNTSNTAITNNNTNIPTMNTIYYGLVAVNGNSQSRATTIYVPTSTGASGQLLKSNGSSAPGWITSNIGSSTQPIYLSSGAPTACTVPSSGAWWTAIPQIQSDGVMEIGKYIDFHTTSNGTTDYDVRITAATTGLTISGTTVGTFSGNLSGNASTATTASKLGTDTKGSTTKPIYLSSGAPTECSTYAGGTKVTLNGSNKGASTASFYAPTSVGTSGYILKSNGSGAPTWLQTLPIANGGTGATSAADAPWVQKSGDTMTGYLTYKDSTIDASKANNNVSSIEYPTTFNIVDSQERIITRQEGIVTSDGNISGFWYVRNYNTSGESLGTKGIQITMNKSGELTTVIKNNQNLTIDKNSCIQRNAISSSWLNGRANALIYLNTSDGYSTLASIKTTNGTWSIGHYRDNIWNDRLMWTYIADSRTENGRDSFAYLTATGEYHADKVWGAVYNDYAEMRNVPEAQNEDNPLRPGTCVREVGDGTMIPTIERLQRGCKIISDTFGFNIGETDDCQTPIAVSGRALVYLDVDRDIAKDYIGYPVCSGPNGTVSIMTEEEEEKYPSRIVGIISEIPDYEKWGSSDVKVNGRIWIYVR